MKAMPEVRAVTFDVGGTLLEPWPSVGHVYARLAAPFGLTQLDVAALNARFVEAWRRRANFDYARASWHRLVQETFGDVTVSAECFAALYEGFGAAEAWRIYEDVGPALKALRRRGVRLGVISNWDERLRPLLRSLGLEEYFEVIVVSHEAGDPKPSPLIFARAASAMALPPDAMLHVGDSGREDVAGAKAAGFRALLLDRLGSEGGTGDESMINSLRELAGWL
jgi:putative hydrolase of the HAD superfamily